MARFVYVQMPPPSIRRRMPILPDLEQYGLKLNREPIQLSHEMARQKKAVAW